jgi:hypothetical protein
MIYGEVSEMKDSLNTAFFRSTVLITILFAGCEAAYFLLPPEKETIPAEFEGLPGHSLAVVLDVPDQVYYDHPNVRRSLGTAVSMAIGQHVDRVTIITPSRVVRYQDDHPNWKINGFKTLGKSLGVEYVLLIAIHKYSGIAEGMTTAVQGTIIADAELHAAFCNVNDTLVWRTKESIDVVFPPRNKLYETSKKNAVLFQTERVFAEKIASKFYDSTFWKERI